MTSVAATPSSKPTRGRRGSFSTPEHRIRKIVISTDERGYTSDDGVTAKLLFGAKSHKIKIMSKTKQIVICETDIQNVSKIRLAPKAVTGGGHPSVTIIADKLSQVNSELEEMSAMKDSCMPITMSIDWDRFDLEKFMDTIEENSDTKLGQWLKDRIVYTNQSNEQQENMLLSLESMTLGARRNSSVDAGLAVVRLVRVDALERIVDVGTGFFVKQAGKIILVTAKHVVLGAVRGAVTPFRIFVGVMDSTDNPPVWKYEVDQQSIMHVDDWDVAAMSLLDNVILECDPPVGWSSKDEVLRFTKADAVAVDSGKFTEAMARTRTLECRSDMEEVKIMDKLLVIGFPTIVNRNVQFSPTQVGGFEKDRMLLKLNTRVIGGSSGSPALDENNRVVCVCSCTLGTTDMYVSVDVIHNMLIKVKKE